MRLIDTEAAARALGCSRRQIQVLVSEGKLTNHGAPRRISIDLDELYDRRIDLVPPRRQQPSGGVTD